MSTEPSARAPQATARSGAPSSASTASATARFAGNKTEGASFLMALQSAGIAPEDASAQPVRAEAEDTDALPGEWSAQGLIPVDVRPNAPAIESNASGLAQNVSQQPSVEVGLSADRAALGAGKAAPGKPGWTTLAAQRTAKATSADAPGSEQLKPGPAGHATQGNSLADASAGGTLALTGWLTQGLQGVSAALASGHLVQGAALSANASATTEGSALGDGALGAAGSALSSDASGRSRDSGGSRDNSAAAAAGWQVDASGADALPGSATEAFADALQHADVQQMAEQVSVWVGAGVQEAELKIDRLGQGPVEVSISMDGARADIVFRSDEAGAREALSQSMAQLQALMQEEGLTLGSMSVASQGRSSSDGAPNRGPGAAVRLDKNAAGAQGLQDALDRALDKALSPSGGRPGGVDVFV